MLALFLAPKGTSTLSPLRLYESTLPLTVQEDSLFFTLSPAFIACRLLRIAILTNVRGWPHYSFDLHFFIDCGWYSRREWIFLHFISSGDLTGFSNSISHPLILLGFLGRYHTSYIILKKLSMLMPILVMQEEVVKKSWKRVIWQHDYQWSHLRALFILIPLWHRCIKVSQVDFDVSFLL